MRLHHAFLIGALAGLRSLTAPAVTAWAIRRGRIEAAPPLSLLGSKQGVIALSGLAALELAGDKLPMTPNRTEPAGLVARMLTGGLAGACLAANARQGAWRGAVLGAAGGVGGAFVGQKTRARLVKALGTPDYPVALLEDLIAIGGSLWVVSRASSE